MTSASPILAAEFTAGSARRGPVVTIRLISNGVRFAGEVVDVTDKRQARRIAIARGAKPWNF